MTLLWPLVLMVLGAAPDDTPRVEDPRLIVERFAAAPDIVHPVSLDFDRKGRLLVIESHTHFRPQNYQGPKHDRIRIVEDRDGDGRADQFSTFYEGLRATMDLAVHPDGSVYVATRNEILRLRDTDEDGKADDVLRLAFLETKGDYPHNGLSGLAFDWRGDVVFGMGENLGASYKLVGRDGTTLNGEGEGGNVFTCKADGTRLKRVATGFWNPFSTTRDLFGRWFTVDNDPDSSPPCRLLHLVEGGDYGYQFRYGRAGRHVFQCWNGQLPGTLPMMSGTGESPCEIVSYESDGLPAEYLGQLLVTAWADHRVERYVVKPQGASFVAERKPFIQGGPEFRPVGLAVAPDGSLFVSDWVLRDYNLHGRGAIWHIRSRDKTSGQRPEDPKAALESLHRPLREAAARRLAASDAGRAYLQEQMQHRDPRVRAVSLTALRASTDKGIDLAAYADREQLPDLRAMAVRELAARGADVKRFRAQEQPGSVQRAALDGQMAARDLPQLLQFLKDEDPFLRNAAIQALVRQPDLLRTVEIGEQLDPRCRAGLLLAHRATEKPEGRALLPEFLADRDEDVRFLAIKWVADDKLVEQRPLIEKMLAGGKLNVRLYAALATALARLEGKEVNDAQLAEYFLRLIKDAKAEPVLRVLALQQVSGNNKALTAEILERLIEQPDVSLQLEAARALAEKTNPRPVTVLHKVLADAKRNERVRAQAIVGLAETAQEHLEQLLALATGTSPILRDEALRALVGTKLNEKQQQTLVALTQQPATANLAARVLGKPFAAKRPAVTDTAAWLQRLEGPADPEAGRRVFAQARLANCIRCHRAEGRGAVVGPDLSVIGRTERRHLLESILQPSVQVAPHFQAWVLATQDGKVRTGMLVGTNLDEYTYLDEKGNLFKVNTRDLADSQPAATSLMPNGLVDQLTDQEIRDLLAYLQSLR